MMNHRLVVFAALALVTTSGVAGQDDVKSACNRGDVYSIANPNESWTDEHTFHPQVWYHSLQDIYELWQDDYFEYVLDVRPVEEVNSLPGWEDYHIPGSYPLDMDVSLPASEVEFLTNFTSDVCMDSRIFIHCWVGVAGNAAAKTLIDLGFTNVHAAGPEGDAGIIQWESNGYEVVYNDTYNPKRKPKCWRKCRRSEKRHSS